MRIDVLRGTSKAHIAMEIDMADVDVSLISMQRKVRMGDRASLVCVLVGMRVRMSAAVGMAVEVNRVGVIVVTVRVGLV